MGTRLRALGVTWQLGFFFRPGLGWRRGEARQRLAIGVPCVCFLEACVLV